MGAGTLSRADVPMGGPCTDKATASTAADDAQVLPGVPVEPDTATPNAPGETSSEDEADLSGVLASSDP